MQKTKNLGMNFGKGLLPLPLDLRDFHEHIVFGATPAAQLPTADFFAGHPIEIKNQGPLNFCTAFAGSAVVEDEVDVELDPLYLYAVACKLLGSVTTTGMTLRDMCNAIIKSGTIEESLAPYKVTDGHSAQFLADIGNYDETLAALAWEFARISYFRVDTGPSDIFDNIRSGIWQHIDEHRSVLAGVAWRDSWTSAPNGMIPEDYDQSEPGDGHAIKMFGQMTIVQTEGPRLAVQNSWGEEVGDKGLFYFPRSVVNKEFTYGAFSFRNLAPAKADFYNQNGININAATITKIIKTAQGIIKSWI